MTLHACIQQLQGCVPSPSSHALQPEHQVQGRLTSDLPDNRNELCTEEVISDKAKYVQMSEPCLQPLSGELMRLSFANTDYMGHT